MPGFRDALGIGEVQHVAITLIDGLGWHALREFAEHAPVMASSSGSAISTVFPSTTSSALASLGTGMLPGAHGLVGATFYLPETGALLSPLHWSGEPHPVMVQPESTVFEIAERRGVFVTTVSPAAYAKSGLTRAALRGGMYVAVETIAERVEGLRRSIARGARSLTYIYWPELDRLGHEFGVGSRAWIDGLGRVDSLIRRMGESLPPHAAMVVTSDHGMVNCLESDRVDIDSTPELIADVRRVGGEPRARHLYVGPGCADAVASRWQGLLGDRAHVRTREEMVAENWFGPTDDDIAERIGDVVCVGRGRTMMTSKVDKRTSKLVGQHGAVTPEEIYVPCMIIRS